MSFENYHNDTLTLYRGTDFDDPLSQKYIYLSESKDFAADYGKNLYEIKIQPEKIFNSLKENDMRKLFELLGKEGLYDKYNDTTYYSFEEMDEKYTMWTSDTWEMIEDEIYYVSDYDCALITEGGYINYVVFNPDIVTDVRKIEEPLTENRKSEKYNNNKLNELIVKYYNKYSEEMIEIIDTFEESSDIQNIMQKLSFIMESPGDVELIEQDGKEVAYFVDMKEVSTQTIFFDIVSKKFSMDSYKNFMDKLNEKS